jgi:hypothetical protein
LPREIILVILERISIYFQQIKKIKIVGNNYIAILQSIFPYFRVLGRRVKRSPVYMITDAEVFSQGSAQTPGYIGVK